MRRIILALAVTLDSRIEGPNGEYDWCLVDQDYGFSEFFDSIDTVLYGRRSYELFGNMKPVNATDMEKTMFSKMAEMKKYVFSTTLKEAKGAVLINSNVDEEVKKIKAQSGKDIYLFGGAGLITTFANLNLIDEYLLGLHPIILGPGKPGFSDISKRVNLALIDAKVYSTGLVMLRYKPA